MLRFSTERGGIFFRGAESKRAKYLYRLCQLSAARAPFRSDVQKNNAKAITQGGGIPSVRAFDTIPESATRPSTRRATVRAIIMFFPFFLGKAGNGEATLVPFCMRHGRDLHTCTRVPLCRTLIFL